MRMFRTIAGTGPSAGGHPLSYRYAANSVFEDDTLTNESHGLESSQRFG